MSINTDLIWGRRNKGYDKSYTFECGPYEVMSGIRLGAGTGQVHSAMDMTCVNINDLTVGKDSNNSNYSIPVKTPKFIDKNGKDYLGSKNDGSEGGTYSCDPGTFLSESIIHHDDIDSGSADIKQITLKCKDVNNIMQGSKLIGKNTTKNITTVSCRPDSFYNKVLFTEGSNNVTGIGFGCADVSNIIEDQGWRRLNGCRTQTGRTAEYGDYYRNSAVCNTFARQFCSIDNNWMMPACVNWAETQTTDMDQFYISRCGNLTTPAEPVTPNNFITFKFPNGKYLSVSGEKIVLSGFSTEFRIVDTGIRHQGEPVYEFHTVEDHPRYLQMYYYIDENVKNDSSYYAVNRNFQNKGMAFEYGNPFQFMIRKMSADGADGGDSDVNTYWIEKYGTIVSRGVSGGLERFPVYMGFDNDQVILTTTPTYITIENFDRGKVVCSCINADKDLPKLLVDSVGAVGAQAFCYSSDCITGSGYKTGGQKREPCNQQLTICYSNVNVMSELESGGVDIGKINIKQDCGPDNNPSLGPGNSPPQESPSWWSDWGGWGGWWGGESDGNGDGDGDSDGSSGGNKTIKTLLIVLVVLMGLSLLLSFISSFFL